MSVTLSIEAANLSPDERDSLTRDLFDTIRVETDIEPQLVRGPTQGGAKGDPITLGTVALTFLTTGTAVALLKTLAVYFKRQPYLKIKFHSARDRTFELEARHYSVLDINGILREFQRAEIVEDQDE